jgi:alpha-ribazole phosphatase
MAVKNFLLIRHGKTKGNLERRYMGDPDEPLCPEGLQGIETLARSGVIPPIDALVSGPAMRCRQTAELLFPGMKYDLCPMSEIDFGVFKGKNANDLLGDKDYEAWLRTNCMGDIPGGDSVSVFKERCCEVFLQIAQSNVPKITALVVHGGNILAILERFALPKKDFYAYHIPNGGFFMCKWENGVLTVEVKRP